MTLLGLIVIPRCILGSPMAQNDKQQTECRNRLGKPLSRPCADMEGGLHQGKLEHRMGEEGTQTASKHLAHDICPRFLPGQRTTQGQNQRDRRVEVSTTDRAEQANEYG